MSTNGYAKLARVIQNRIMEQQNDGNYPVLEFATILEGLKLKIEDFPHDFIREEYLICNRILGGVKAGDKVLIAWVQSAPIVIDLINAGVDEVF